MAPDIILIFSHNAHFIFFKKTLLTFTSIDRQNHLVDLININHFFMRY